MAVRAGETWSDQRAVLQVMAAQAKAAERISSIIFTASQFHAGSADGNDLFGSMKVNKQLATSTTVAVLYTTAVMVRIAHTNFSK